MSRKLVCSITGDWTYCSEERWDQMVAKAGSEQKMLDSYQSRKGKQLVKEHDGNVTKARGGATQNNKIACSVTGELMYISDERMKKLTDKAGSEKAVREGYVSRVAMRLRNELAEKQQKGEESSKPFADLPKKDRIAIDKEIRAQADAGKLPPPSAPKGSQKQAPTSSAPDSSKKPDTQVKDTSAPPAGSKQDQKLVQKTQPSKKIKTKV